MIKQNQRYKKQDNICVRIGHQTKSDLMALAQANEMNLAEYVRLLIREAIEENQDVIYQQQFKGIKVDLSEEI